MEAMAKGLPIVASAAGGIPEGLGDTGKLLSDPNINPEKTVLDLVETLQEWVMNPELRSQIGAASKQRAEQLFKEDRMLKQTLEIIQIALTSSQGNRFNNLPFTQTDVKHLNSRLEYASLLWNAWYYYTQNNTSQMVHCLQQSLKYSSFEFITEAVLDWVNDFARLSSYKQYPLDASTLSQSPQWQYAMERILGIVSRS
ncbi:glycosyltransferase, partial [Planktothrix sp.]|uniref:glycosyltransferase n=1 Tax=Planktothrix sp. TaxID=3088171 RepID=UPI0038D381CE